jgi:four helix bundle protein
MKTQRETGNRNPKAEIRGPKESRNPKSEFDAFRRASGLESPFWSWGEAELKADLALHEDGSSKNTGAQDLHERTSRFGEAIIGLAKQIPQNPVNNRLITQLVGAGTSVGANYCEADDAISGKEFKQKIGTCRKESKETMFFLRMLATAEPGLAEARRLWREAKELNLIFGAIWRK